MQTKVLTFDSVTHELEGTKVLIPTISVGFIPMFTTELFVKALDLPFFAAIDTDLVVPICSSDDQGVKLPITLHGPIDDMYVLVLRSHPLRGQNVSFVQSVVSFLKSNRTIPIVLSSTDKTQFSPLHTTPFYMQPHGLTPSVELPIWQEELPGGTGNTQKFIDLLSEPWLLLLGLGSDSFTVESVVDFVVGVAYVLGVELDRIKLSDFASRMLIQLERPRVGSLYLK
ncbi:hypothetical protein P9112_009194 [Eukaryota sp. TZLM1-RC]